jgi:hypothetical protein
MSIRDSDWPGNRGQRDDASRPYADSNGIPAYLTASKATASVSKTKSSASNPYDSRSDYAGAGGKSQTENTTSENTAPGKDMKTKGQTYINEPGWSTAKVKTPKASMRYNAWDNAGQVHSQYRASSQSTAVTSSTGISGRQDVRPTPSGPSGTWVKPVSLEP